MDAEDDFVFITSRAERAYHVAADRDGIWFSSENLLIEIDPRAESGDRVQKREAAYFQTEITGFVHRGERFLVRGADGVWAVYGRNARRMASSDSPDRADFVSFGGGCLALADRDVPAITVRKWEQYPAAFTYDPTYEHSEARIHTDRITALLFRHDRFRIISTGGEILADGDIPDAPNVRDPQYRRPGDTDFLGQTVTAECLEVQYHDGMIRKYDAKTGDLLDEAQEPDPDPTLYEEFVTADYRVTSPLHGTPEVYDRSGRRLGALESEAELAYVAQIGGSLMAHYVTSDGEWYGILLNEQMEPVADFPNLCDLLPDGTVIFDDMAGNLRLRRILNAEELIALTEQESHGYGKT